GLAASTLRLRAYRDRTWKIIVPRDQGEPELFRYTTDPGERHDLAREYPEKLRELLRRAEELRTDRFFSETASDPAAHALSPETRRELETLGYVD
ncbi:MAG: hypothetical protein KC591_09050, partial [Gemmatimonadetes bacterium]|nr:hypothetical protein [Gemmatimonadota bacterium]